MPAPLLERQEAVLKFFPNRKPSSRLDSSPSISGHEGIVVFPDKELGRAIASQCLVGKSLQIMLQVYKTARGTHVWTASKHPRKNLVLQTADLGGKEVAVIIDGQNLLGSMRRLGLKSMVDTISRVLRPFRPKLINLYLGANDLIQLLPADRTALHSGARIGETQLTLFTVETRRVADDNGTRMKNNIDGSILPILGELTNDRSCEGLILFTGDKDFSTGVELWMGIGEQSHRPGRPAIVVSADPMLSTELREAMNHPRGNLIFLEDLC